MSTALDREQGKKSGRGLCLWICISFVLLLLSGLSLFSCYLRGQVRKAVSAIDSLNKVATGTSGDAAVAALLNAGGRRFQPCQGAQRAGVGVTTCNDADEGEEYGVYFGVPYELNHLLYEHPLLQYPLQCFGIHPWMAQLSLTKIDGKVTGLSYSVSAARKDGAYVISEVQVSPRPIRESGETTLYRINYSQRRNLIPDLFTWISPNLQLDERRRLATFRLKCLTTFRGCTEPQEISPGAWMEYSRHVR